MRNGFPVHFYFFDGIRVQVKVEFFGYCFKQDNKTGYFNSTACTSGAGSYKHKENKDRFGKNRPLVKVSCGISCSCNNRANLKRRLLKSYPYIIKHMRCVYSNGKYGGTDNTEVIAKLLHLKCLNKFLCEKKKIHIEIYAKQNHKYGNNYLNIGAVTSDAVVSDAKSSCSGCAERDT